MKKKTESKNKGKITGDLEEPNKKKKKKERKQLEIKNNNIDKK
jgi:hypothetical protein